MPVLAAVNRGFLKNRTSSIGWSVVRSHQMKARAARPPARTTPRIVGSVQPSVGASMIA